MPIYFLRIRIEIIRGQKEWDAMVDRICNLAQPQPAPEWDNVL